MANSPTRHDDVSLLELLDRALDRGVVIGRRAGRPLSEREYITFGLEALEASMAHLQRLGEGRSWAAAPPRPRDRAVN